MKADQLAKPGRAQAAPSGVGAPEHGRFGRLFAEAPAAFLMLDRDGTILEANQAAGRLLRTRRSLSGEQLTRYLTREDEAQARHLMESALRGDADVCEDLRLHLTSNPSKDASRDGHVIPVRARATAWAEAADTLVLLALTDESACHLVEEELRETRQRHDDFLAMLAHELRNPLTPLLSIAQLFLRTPDDAERVLRVAAIVERQVLRLVRLADDLQDTTRLGQGLLSIERRRVELAAILHRVVAAKRDELEAAGHSLTWEPAGGGPSVDGDPARLEQVFHGLLDSVVRTARRGGGIELALLGNTDPQAAVAEVRVHNPPPVPSTGATDPPSESNGQSEPIQLQARRLGMGFELARRLVELHGGTIEVHGHGPGTGASFTVRLPLAD